jgi:hypothetical protein
MSRVESPQVNASNKGGETKMAAELPTIVLVHGAWADATGFDAGLCKIAGIGRIGFGNPFAPCGPSLG